MRKATRNKKSELIPASRQLRLYEAMLKIRKVQLKIEEEYPKDEMKTPVHLCKGQEAVPAGLCAHLKKTDHVYSNHRGHGHYIAKGGDLKAFFAELYGRETGCSKGRGGSVHLADVSVGLMGSSSIVAGAVPVATGAALSFKMQKNKKVSVVFLGDGAVDEGAVYDSVNFAVLKKLPVIYACENNFYAVCSPQSQRHYRDDIYQRFCGCGIPGYRVDGNNVLDVYRVSGQVIEYARRGKGPSFVEFRTYRWCGHSAVGTDLDLGYRGRNELELWMKRCPLHNYEKRLFARGILNDGIKRRLERKIDAEITAAVDYALASPFPNKADLTKYLFKELA